MRARAPVLASLALALCSTGACTRTSDGDDDVASDTRETGDCEPGSFGCACVEDGCLAGLECVGDLCELVDDEGGEDEGNLNSCGWNGATSWYDCGFSGEDPSAEFPRACPEIPLSEGAACPEELSFAGCCDSQGNLWFCDEQTRYRDC